MADPTTPSVEPITVGEGQIKALTGLSPKSVKRAADRGEPTGRFHVGNRVLFDYAKLKAWLAAKADAALGSPAPATT